jgi:hypothetical protein
MELTQSLLKEWLRYDPVSGVFTWFKSGARGRRRIGTVAGSVNNTGYIRIKVQLKRHSAHRLAYLYMYGAFPHQEVDHINGVKHDNRWCNLRRVSHQENSKNRPLASNNASGVSGVRWKKDRNSWGARIYVGGKEINLGCTKDWFEAVCAKKSAENKYGFHVNHGRLI